MIEMKKDGEYNSVLNIAAGKFTAQSWEGRRLVKDLPTLEILLDSNYNSEVNCSNIETFAMQWMNSGVLSDTFIKCKADIYEFLEKTILSFNHVCMYRFLEHVPFDRLLYFIYLISTVTRPDSYVDVIVPNYKVLGDLLIKDSPYSDKNFEANNILLTTELVNEPSCPHASIWTPERAKYFFELEGRFTVDYNDVLPTYKFDGRDIYMRFLAKRE